MVTLKALIISAISMYITLAQPTSPDMTENHHKHRGQLAGYEAPFDCATCQDTVDKVVCATDGNTYVNDCKFKCAKSQDPDLEIEHRKACQKDRVECSCTDDSETTVCGTDGKTYKNICELNCENWLNGFGATVNVTHDGPCEEISNRSIDIIIDSFNQSMYRSREEANQYMDAVIKSEDVTAEFAEIVKNFTDTTNHNFTAYFNEAIRSIQKAVHEADKTTRFITKARGDVENIIRKIEEFNKFAETLH